MSSAERIGPMFIVVVVFIATAAALVSWMETDTAPEGAIPTQTNLNGIAYSAFTPGAGRAYTSANITNNYNGLPNAKATHFTEPSNPDPFSVTIVRNSINYHHWFVTVPWESCKNYIAIEQHGWPYVDRMAIPLSDITDAHNATYTTSASVVLSINGFDKAAYVIVITASSASTFTTDVFANNINIKIGLRTDPGAPTTEPQWWEGIWNFLADVVALLTGQIMPEVPYLSWAISVAIWAAIAFLLYEFVTRAYGGG